VTREIDRLSNLELKVESAMALDARLKALEDGVKQLKPRSSLRDWIQTLGPYLSGLIILIVGFWLKDSVTMAFQREQLDLSYVKDVRELIENFDKATEQSSADTNAIALAMYGKFALVPLIERLETGDVAKIAAERGLRLVGANQPEAACPRFANLLDDPSPRFTWQTHKTIIRLLGSSGCIQDIGLLETYVVTLDQAAADPAELTKFASRFSNPGVIDAETVDSLRTAAMDALTLLKLQKSRSDGKERPWWR
jgi:hypothetical protein